MRFNIISETSDGMGFGVRLLAEGNDCRIWIRDKDAAEVGDGMVPKAGSLDDILVDLDIEDDVVIFDSSGNGVCADYLRSKNIAVFGGSFLADKLEHDRGWATSVMQDCGIATPETFSFTDWGEGREFAKEFKGRLVYKPSKLLGELSCSHVSFDTEDLLEMLDNAEEESSIEHPEFDLQEFVEGVVISSEGWFDGQQWLPLFNHTLERKELMDGNLGPSGGCAGNIVWVCDGECPICRNGIRRLEGFLRKNDYRGMLDLNAVVNRDGVHGLEFTPRCGYDATPTLCWGLLDGELGQFFYDIAHGQYREQSSPGLRGGIAGAVRITIPPWPTEKFHADKNIPIRGLSKEEVDSDVYWYNVKRDEDKPTKYASAGAWGIICLLVGRGDSIGRALSRPMKMADAIRVPDKQYRTDLVEQFKKDLEKLDEVQEAVA